MKNSPLLGKLFKGLIVFLSWFSLKNQQRIGAGLGKIQSWFPNYNHQVVSANIKTAFPSLNAVEQRQLVVQSLQENSKSFSELGAIWGWPIEKVLPLIKKVHGEELIAQAFQENKGLVMLSPHFGCWEITSLYLIKNYDLTFLYQPPKNKSVENYISEVRSRSGGHAATTDVRGVKTLVKALRQNKMIGILPDQDPGEVGSCYAPFFNHPARTMTLVSKMARIADEKVLFIVAERLPNGTGYELHIFPAEADIASQDAEVATAALNRGVEACVNINPAQYLWSYKRYRHPPASTPDIYQ